MAREFLREGSVWEKSSACLMVDVDVVRQGKGQKRRTKPLKERGGVWVGLRKIHNFEGPCGLGVWASL